MDSPFTPDNLRRSRAEIQLYGGVHPIASITLAAMQLREGLHRVARSARRALREPVSLIGRHRSSASVGASTGQPQPQPERTVSSTPAGATQQLDLQTVQHDCISDALLLPGKSRTPSLRHVLWRLDAVHSTMSPKGSGANDRSFREHVINVVTSLPFIAVGLAGMRTHKTVEGRRFGASLAFAGLAATAYHAAPHGRSRKALRKLDHWSISLATSIMLRAICPTMSQGSRKLSLASLALIPFRPTVVTIGNIGVAECRFIHAAAADPKLRPTWRRHVAALAAGGACFASEDAGIKHLNLDCLHPLWHCLACYAVAGTEVLIPTAKAQ